MLTKQDPVVHYLGHMVVCRPNESLLDAMLRSGLEIDFSCKSGVCHRCMLRCIEGEAPAQSSKKLPKHQQDAGCILACQCKPSANLIVAPKSPEDLLTRCVASSLTRLSSGHWQLRFESMRVLPYQTGQLAEILDQQSTAPILGTLTSSPEEDEYLSIEFDAASQLPAWLNAWAPDTVELVFCLRGPLPIEPTAPIVALAPDPQLWEQLGGDPAVRALLTTFYQTVYADAQLAPFFERVTMDRIIGKQFAFLKQNIQGVPVFLGEQPRNTHNWMVINDALFDHRQHLMLKAMQAHALPEHLIGRLTDYEEQFRAEIVKYKPWPKRFGDLMVDTEQYETCMLEEATVCDYCGEEIACNTLVKYHKRIAKIGCVRCTKNSQMQ